MHGWARISIIPHRVKYKEADAWSGLPHLHPPPHLDQRLIHHLVEPADLELLKQAAADEMEIAVVEGFRFGSARARPYSSRVIGGVMRFPEFSFSSDSDWNLAESSLPSLS